jgi:hypothetical protein
MAGNGCGNMRLSTQAGRGNEVIMVGKNRVKLFFYVAMCRVILGFAFFFLSVALTLNGDAHEIAET